MLKVSANSFTKKTLSTGSGSFAAGSDLPKSANTFSANKFADPDLKIGSKAWEGQNTSDAGLGDDLYSPESQGVNEAGGIRHFVNRVQPSVSH